jgi:hypothetical protein
MPHQIITREVSTSVWHKPKTWGTYRLEWKYLWDMNNNLYDHEIEIFIEDELLGNPWRVSKVQVLGQRG